MIKTISSPYWQERWQTAATGWDLQGPHPLLKEAISILWTLTQKSLIQRWLVPGCGRAHDAAAIADMGFEVQASDVVPEAVFEANKLYSRVPNLDIRVANALDESAVEVAAFDAIYDRAMMCALDLDERLLYLRACQASLRQGGWFLSIPFGEVGTPDGGPPFQTTEQDLKDHFCTGWRIGYLREHEGGVTGKNIRKEFIFAAQKL